MLRAYVAASSARAACAPGCHSTPGRFILSRSTREIVLESRFIAAAALSRARLAFAVGTAGAGAGAAAGAGEEPLKPPLTATTTTTTMATMMMMATVDY